MRDSAIESITAVLLDRGAVSFFEGADPKFSVGIVDLHAVGQASNVVQQRAGFYQPDPTGSASRFQDP
jgi:hypothetical protein